MQPEIKTIAQAADSALSAVAACLTPSTQESQTSDENAHKRAFLETFRRWAILFKRADSGDITADMWLVAEYYKSLRHLNADGFEHLTEELKRRCTFFPSVKECLEVINPSKYSYESPFCLPRNLFRPIARIASSASGVVLEDMRNV